MMHRFRRGKVSGFCKGNYHSMWKSQCFIRAAFMSHRHSEAGGGGGRADITSVNGEV